MTIQLLTGWQASWWEILSVYNLNIVYRAGKNNLTDTPSSWPDYARPLESLCVTTVLTVRSNAMFCLRQLYAAAVQKDQIIKDMLPDSLLDLVRKGLAEDYTVKAVRTVLNLTSRFPAEEYSILATWLCQYQSHWH